MFFSHLKIKTLNNEAALNVTLYYLSSLNIVTVNCSVSNMENKGVISGYVSIWF